MEEIGQRCEEVGDDRSRGRMVTNVERHRRQGRGETRVHGVQVGPNLEVVCPRQIRGVLSARDPRLPCTPRWAIRIRPVPRPQVKGDGGPARNRGAPGDVVELRGEPEADGDRLVRPIPAVRPLQRDIVDAQVRMRGRNVVHDHTKLERQRIGARSCGDRRDIGSEVFPSPLATAAERGINRPR